MIQLNEIKRMQQLAGILTESQLNEKMSYDDFEQMIKPFIDLAKSKGWIWNSSGDSWFEVGSPAIALYHSTELPTTADGEYKGQKMLASKDVIIGNQVQTYRGNIGEKQADVIMQSDYNMDQAYFQSKDKAILDAIKASMANVTDVVEDTKESSSQLTTSKSFEPVKYYYMVLRKKQAQQAESTESQLNEEEQLGVGHKFANGQEIKYAVGTKFDTSSLPGSTMVKPGVWVITKYQPNGNIEVKCESGEAEGKTGLWNMGSLQNFLKLGMKPVQSSTESTESQLDTNKIGKMNEMNSEWEKEIWKVLKAKFDLDPTTATIKFGPNGMSIKPVDYQVWADKFTKGRQTGGTDNHNINAKADKIAAYFNKKYGKAIVAESLDPLDEVINNALKAAGIK